MAELRKRRRRFIRLLLIANSSAAAALMLGGLIVWLVEGRHVARAVTPAQVLSRIDLGDRLMMAGILLLAITPALAVAALLTLWLRERAWRFAAASALVLSLLGAALLLGDR